MLERRYERRYCGANFFAVYGKEEELAGFIEYTKNKATQPIDIRIIGGFYSLGRTKIIITGSIIYQMSFDTFYRYILSQYTLID